MNLESTDKKTALKKYFLQDWLIPIIVHLIALAFLSIPIALVLASLLRLPRWLILVSLPMLFLCLFGFYRTSIVIRYYRLKICEEVSASKCADQFLNLARYLFTNRRTRSKAVSELRSVAEVRRHPNLRFLQGIEKLLEKDQSPAGIEAVRRYLSVVPAARTIVRERTIQNLMTFLREQGPDKYIVLYGYSNTICEALVQFGGSDSCPIFVIEDLQYGLERSLAEHREIERHLRDRKIEPIMLPFEEIGNLCSATSNFVRTESNRNVPLGKRRQLVALIGCEAMDVNGTALIPSKRQGVPSETAKFAEVFYHAQKQSDTDLVARRLVIASESYKVYSKVDADLTSTHAPVKVSLISRYAYLVGILRKIRPIRVELVRLDRSDYYAVVDDHSVHRGGSSLTASVQQWEAQLNPRVQQPLEATQPFAVLQSCTTVIFDKDGVLSDNEPLHFAAFADTAREVGSSLNYSEYLETCAGLSDEEGARNLIRLKGINAEVIELVRLKTEKYGRYVPSPSRIAFPLAVELVQSAIAAGKQLYLVTASSSTETDKFIEGLALNSAFRSDRRFCNVQYSDRRKVYLKILEASGGDPSKCILLDDSPRNLALARALKLRTIAFATYRSIDVSQADLVVVSPRDLLRWWRPHDIDGKQVLGGTNEQPSRSGKTVSRRGR